MVMRILKEFSENLNKEIDSKHKEDIETIQKNQSEIKYTKLK